MSINLPEYRMMQSRLETKPRSSWRSWIPEDIWKHIEDLESLTPLVIMLEDNNETGHMVKCLRSRSEEYIFTTLKHVFTMNYHPKCPKYSNDFIDDHFRRLARLLKKLTLYFYGPEVPDRSFTLFGKLPPEIQDMIWARALPVERIFQINLLLTDEDETTPSSPLFCYSLGKNTKKITAEYLSIALACKASYEMVLKRYKSIVSTWNIRKIPVDFNSDVFSFGTLMGFSWDLLHLQVDQRVDRLEKYKHFRRITCSPSGMFRMMHGDSFQYLDLVLRPFENLEELIITDLDDISLFLRPHHNVPLCFVQNEATVTSTWQSSMFRDIREQWKRATAEGGLLERFRNVKLTWRYVQYDYLPTVSQFLQHHTRQLIETEYVEEEEEGGGGAVICVGLGALTLSRRKKSAN